MFACEATVSNLRHLLLCIYSAAIRLPGIRKFLLGSSLLLYISAPYSYKFLLFRTCLPLTPHKYFSPLLISSSTAQTSSLLLYLSAPHLPQPPAPVLEPLGGRLLTARATKVATVFTRSPHSTPFTSLTSVQQKDCPS